MHSHALASMSWVAWEVLSCDPPVAGFLLGRICGTARARPLRVAFPMDLRFAWRRHEVGSIAETSAAARGRWPVRPIPSGNRGHRGVTDRQGRIAERTARRKTRP